MVDLGVFVLAVLNTGLFVAFMYYVVEISKIIQKLSFRMAIHDAFILWYKAYVTAFLRTTTKKRRERIESIVAKTMEEELSIKNVVYASPLKEDRGGDG